MILYDPIWPYMTLYDISSENLEGHYRRARTQMLPLGISSPWSIACDDPVWPYMTLYDPIWPPDDPILTLIWPWYDPIWSYMGLYDPILTLYDSIWPWMTLYDPIWPYMTLYDPTWPYMTLIWHWYDPIWPCMALYDPILTLYDPRIGWDWIGLVRLG